MLGLPIMHANIFQKLAAFLLLVALPQVGVAAEPPSFPWGCPPAPTLAAASSAIGYSVLPRAGHHAPSSLPVQTLPDKPHYAYGWFGSDPNSHKNTQWGRHFGFSQSYTQWTKR